MLKSDVSLFRRLKLLFLPVLIIVFCSFRSPEYYYMGSS